MIFAVVVQLLVLATVALVSWLMHVTDGMPDAEHDWDDVQRRGPVAVHRDWVAPGDVAEEEGDATETLEPEEDQPDEEPADTIEPQPA